MATTESLGRDPVLAPILDYVYGGLWRSMHNRDDGRRNFICYYDLEAVWTQPPPSDSRPPLNALATALSWGPDDVRQIRQKYLRIMSILLWIAWPAWRDFKNIFLDQPALLCDENLPVEAERFLADHYFSGYPAYPQQFRLNQYIFLPIIIRHNADAQAHEVKWSDWHRLPSIESVLVSDKGATGVVTKELIAARHIRYHNDSINTKKRWVAVKTIRATDDLGKHNFQTETDNQKAFRECLTHNKNIMLSIATVIQGSSFHIVSDLADCNLFEFLYGQHDSFRTRSSKFTPYALIQEFRCIVGALKFLHDGLETRAGSIVCAHMDLKPENILVTWDNQSPVGLWQITDFGISVVKQLRHSEDQHLHPISALALGNIAQKIAEMTPTAPRRFPGPFQAPEVQNTTQRVVGQESDMWSLGCILATLLSFASGGPPEVDRLDHSRSTAEDDYFYATTDTLNAYGQIVASERRVKQQFRAYLENLGPNTVWMASCRTLVFDLLRITPSQRLQSRIVHEQVKAVESEMARASLNRQLCGWAPRAPSLSEPAGLIAVEGEVSRRSSRSSRAATYAPTTPDGSTPRLQSVVTASNLTLQTSPESPQIRLDVLLHKSSLFVKLDVRRRNVDRARLSPASHRVAYVSRSGISLYLLDFLREEHRWELRSRSFMHSTRTIAAADVPMEMKGQIHFRNDAVEITSMSIEGTFVAFLVKHLQQRTHQVRLFQFVPSSVTAESSSLCLIEESVPFTGHCISVSIHGDVLVHADESIHLSQADMSKRASEDANFAPGNAANRVWRQLDFSGVLQAASFSQDGLWIYLWSRFEGCNHYYIWRRGSKRPMVRGKMPFNTSGRHTQHNSIIIPFATKSFFLTCDDQGTVTMIGGSAKSATCHRLPTSRPGIVAGCIVPEENAAILLRKIQGNPSNNEVLILQLPEPLASCALKDEHVSINGSFDSIDPSKCSFTVSRTSAGVVLTGAHPNGLLERRVIAR